MPTVSVGKAPLPSSTQDMEFVLYIQHNSPLLISSTIRGNQNPDPDYLDPEDVGGLDITLISGAMNFSTTSNLRPNLSTTGEVPNWNTGCDLIILGNRGPAHQLQRWCCLDAIQVLKDECCLGS